MGITGLIPFLENASTPIKLSALKGSSVAVDSYCWLHRGVFACAEKLARGEETDIYVNYCLKYVDMLTNHNIKVVMVFDGRHLPAKAETERRRREARQESRKLAKEYLRKNEIEKARSHMKRAVDVTHEMALRLIKACRERGVDCIVAPYEADAQMAWLNKTGLADYVITEDSDLTLFGAEKVLFKLDLYGSALLVEKTKLHLAMGCRPEKYTFDKFQRMCILSGCDYLDSLPGIGLKKACKFMLTTEEDDMTKALKKLPTYLKMKNLVVSEEYIEQFLKAEATFRHMFIYNPLTRQMERLCELDEYQTEEKYCSNAGTLLEDKDLAFQLALGNINPFSLEQLDNWHPDNEWSNITKNKKKNLKLKSIWRIQANEQFSCPKPKDKSCVELSFKKIEYKIIPEVESNESLVNEKLDEADVFSMYSDTLGTKRKRTSIEGSDEEQEDIKVDENEDKSKSNSFNPFAKNNLAEEEETKLRVCASGSLLKILSPRKINKLQEEFNTKNKSDVKSRFFAHNVMHVNNNPFVASELTGEMIQIEEKTLKSLEIQRTLYLDSSPEIKSEKSNEPNTATVDTQPNNASNVNVDLKNHSESIGSHYSQNEKMSSPAIRTHDVIEISEDEDGINQSSSVLSQCSSSSSTTNKPRPLGLQRPKTSDKGTKKNFPNDNKQAKLSMFGFKKRPKLGQESHIN